MADPIFLQTHLFGAPGFHLEIFQLPGNTQSGCLYRVVVPESTCVRLRYANRTYVTYYYV